MSLKDFSDREKFDKDRKEKYSRPFIFLFKVKGPRRIFRFLYFVMSLKKSLGNLCLYSYLFCLIASPLAIGKIIGAISVVASLPTTATATPTTSSSTAAVVVTTIVGHVVAHINPHIH